MTTIISKFSFSYPKTESRIIHNLNLKLEAGQIPSRAAIIGSNDVVKP